MALQIEAATGTHIGDKKEQQDRLAVLPGMRGQGTLLALVADGMGGLTGGTMAAEQVISTARQLFDTWAPATEPGNALLRTIAEEAHVAVRLCRFTSEQEPHSTLAALLVQGERADWAHSGDSRVYHFRGGALLYRTVDHSYVEQLYREGRIAAGERDTHAQRNLLTSCLGARETPQLDFGAAESLRAGDSFLLCTDGLWGYFTDQELGAVLQALPARQAAEKLVATARARAKGNGDNVSLVIVKLS
jgi:serine/threonine protein phosphatase PrpC